MKVALGMVARPRRHVSLSEAAHDLGSIIARLARVSCDGLRSPFAAETVKQGFAATWNLLKLKTNHAP
jgi:hypothetical protein